MSFNLETISSILLRGTHRFAEKVNQEFTNLEYSSNVDIKGDLSKYTEALYYLIEGLQYRLERNLFDDTTTALTEELERRLGTYIDTSTIDNNYLPPKGTIVVPVGVFNNTFLLLTDTPYSYTGQSGKAVAVNTNATGLEFIPFPTPTPYTVNNGLTASTSNNFQWGGSLTQSTNVDGVTSTYGVNFTNLNFFQAGSGTGSSATRLNITNNGNTYIGLNDGSVGLGVTNDGRGPWAYIKGTPSLGIYLKNPGFFGQNVGAGITIYDSQDFVGLYYPTSGSYSGSTWYSGGTWAGDYSVAGIHYAGDRWIPHVGYVKSLINVNLPDGIISGLGMSISSSNVVVALGSWRIGGVAYATTGSTTLALDARDATLSRYDSVYADNTNTLHIISGALSATPVHPDIPGGTIRVGDVLITPTTTTTLPIPVGSYVTTTTDQPFVYGNKQFRDSLVVSGLFEAIGGCVIGGGDWYGTLQLRSEAGQGNIRFSNQYSAGYDCSIYQTNINGPSDLVLSNTGYAGSLRARGNDLYDSSGNIFLKSGGGSTVSWSSITSKPTTLSGFGITDAVAATGGTMTGALVITTATGVSPLTVTAFNGGYLGVTSTGLSFKGVSTDFTNNGSTNLLHLGDGTQSALSSMPHLQVTTAPSVSNDVVRLTDLSAYLKLVGGSLTGDVQQSVGPVNSSSLITKGYVDTAIANSSIYFASGTLLGSGTSGSPYSPNATNGLNVSAGSGIQLGGALTLNTTITLGSFSLTFSGTPIVTGIKTASGTGTNVFLDNGTLVATSTFGGVSLSTPNTWTALQTFGTNISIGGVTATGATGTGKVVFDGTPTLVTPILGVATATSINKVTITAPTTSATLTLVTGSTLQTTGAFTLNLTTTATTTPTFTAGTGTVPYIGSTNTWSALQTFGNNISIGGVTSTGATGTGNNVFSIAPSFTGGISVAGGINLNGSTSGIITIQPQAAAGTYNWNLPITAGTSGYLLTSGGGTSTAMTWTDPTTIAALSSTKWATARNLAGNSVDGSASVAFANKFIVQGTADAGLSAAQFLGALGTGIVKNTTTTGVLSIAVAGTDYQGVISLTTTGTTGAATLVGTTLNIPSYAGTVSSVIGGTGLTGGTITTTGTLAIDQSFTPTWTGKHNFTITNTASSAAITNYGVQIADVVNQTLTGNFTDLQINRTTNTPGSGTQLFIDGQVAGTSKFSVQTSGFMTSSAGFNFSGSGTLGIFSQSTTSFDGLFIQNFAAALVGTPNVISPRIRLTTYVWNTTATAASNQVDFIYEVLPISSLVPTARAQWSSRISVSGTGSYVKNMQLDNSGVLYANNFVNYTSALSTLNATGTITAAMVANGVITSTSAAAVTATMDTTANIVTQFVGARGMNIPFTIDNSVGANIVTVALGTGMTSSSVVTGGTTLTVAAGAVGMFNIYLSSTTTSILTRSN